MVLKFNNNSSNIIPNEYTSTFESYILLPSICSGDAYIIVPACEVIYISFILSIFSEDVLRSKYPLVPTTSALAKPKSTILINFSLLLSSMNILAGFRSL